MILPTIIKRTNANWAGGQDEVEMFIFENENIRDETFETHRQEMFMENYEKTKEEIEYYIGDYKISFEKSNIEIHDKSIIL